jgi:signal transduction histidine kinase
MWSGYVAGTLVDKPVALTYTGPMGSNNNKIIKRIALSPLPSLPEVLLQLLQSLTREGVSPKEIAEILRNDPALCVKTLDLAYPSYSDPRRISSLEHVVTEVSIDTLKTLVFTSAVNQVFHRAGEPSQAILSSAWWHSIRSAQLAEIIAQRIRYAEPEEAYLSGLLHNIGGLALAANFPVAYQAFAAEDATQDLHEREILHFGISSTDATLSVISGLRIASLMRDAVKYRTARAERLVSAHPLVQTLHLATALSSAIHEAQALPFQAAEKLFGFQPSAVEDIVEQANAALTKATQLLRMAGQQSSPDAATIEKLKRVRLTNEVREIGLLSRMRPNFSGLRSEIDIYEAIRKALHILFDFGYPIFFRYDAKTDSLVGVPLPGQTELLNQLFVPMKTESSLLVEAVRRKEPLHSFSLAAEERSVIDDEIVGLTQQDGIMCLPLIGRTGVIAVVALGFSQDQLPRLEPQLRLLSTLTTQAGLALDAARKRAQEIPAQPDTEELSVSLSELRKIVHEVNNPLTIMKNYIKILRLKLSHNDPAHGDLAVIDEEIDRVGTILRLMMGPASERAAFRSEAVDVNALIFDLTRVTDSAFTATGKIRLRTELSHDIAPVVADRDRLKQVLVNLLKNAAEAMPAGGAITISTRDNVAHDGKNYVEIQVRDEGPGIPETVKGRLFQAGVTTKGGEHAGLGLSIVQNLIKEVRGQIHCTSEAGRGTIFQIWLPKTRP